MPTPTSISSSSSRRQLLRFLTAAGIAILCAAGSNAQQSLVDGNAFYSFANQSMWGTGGAFQFDDTPFVGLDVDPAAFTVGAESSDKISVPTFLGTCSLNPYFRFDTDFERGVDSAQASTADPWAETSTTASASALQTRSRSARPSR